MFMCKIHVYRKKNIQLRCFLEMLSNSFYATNGTIQMVIKVTYKVTKPSHVTYIYKVINNYSNKASSL